MRRETKRLMIGAVAVFASCVAHAQTLTARSSVLGYQTTFGGGEQSFVAADSAAWSDLLLADARTLTYAESLNGIVGGNPQRPWGALVSVNVAHQFEITGSISKFSRITSQGRAFVVAGTSGEGIATIAAEPDGSALEFRFTMNEALEGHLSGAVSLDPDGQNLAAWVSLQRFDGFLWVTLFDSLLMPTQEGVFDLDLTLPVGEYRFFARAGANAYAGLRPYQHNSWTYDLRVFLPCLADFNRDGGVDGADVDAFFSLWSAGESVADVNEDGGVDGGDVDVFFAHWESGC